MARRVKPRRLTRTVTDMAGVVDMRNIHLILGTGQPPPPDPQWPPAGALWTADMESGVFSDYFSTQNAGDWDNSAAQQPTISTLKKYAGTRSCKYTLPANTLRSECVPVGNSGAISFAEGDDRWFSFRVLWENVPTVDKWANVAVQWQSTAFTSPPLQIMCRNGQIKYGGGWGHPGGTQNYDEIVLGNLTLESWQHFVFHIKFSSNPSIGRSDIWWNGVQVANAYYSPGGTMYPSYTNYVKYGYYHDNTINVASAVWLDNMAVGTTSVSVGGTG